MKPVFLNNVAKANCLVFLITHLIWEDQGSLFGSCSVTWLIMRLLPPTLPIEQPRLELKSSSLQDVLHICSDGSQMAKVILGCQNIIDIAVLLEYPALLLKVHDLRDVGGLSHCKLCDASCWLVSDVHAGDSIFSQFFILRVSPQESVEVHSMVLKLDRVIHLFDVTQSSVHPTSKLQEDCANRVEDVWTLHQHVI